MNTLTELEIEFSIPDTLPLSLQGVLLQFRTVFSVPTGMPLARQCDHRIPLIPNAAPVKVKPYQYPHSQKSEIERMVQ